MTGKETLLNAIRNQPNTRPAWTPFVGVHGAQLLGKTAEAYLRSSDLIVAGLTRAHERYQPDGLPVAFDLQLEAEVLGCELRWAEQTPPAVVSHPLAGQSTDAFPEFDLEAGRLPLVFDALRRCRAEFGDAVGLYGLVTGPLTLGLHLLGNEIFLKMRRDPDAVTRLIGYAAEVGRRTAAEYLRHGADVIAVVDPMTSQISPKYFREFVAPHVNSIFDEVRAAGGLSSLFVCGDATRNLEPMCQTRCDNISIDENVPLELAKQLGAQYGRSFGGNIKLTTALLLGSADDARRDALRCMEVGGTNGFVLAPGCDLPYATPEANLQAVAEMVHDEYQRHVANTTPNARQALSFDDVELPDYRAGGQLIIDVITLDSASCAPCQYMTNAAIEAAARFGDRVCVHEHKITTRSGLGHMLKLGVENVPTICIDGAPRYVSIIPDAEEFAAALQQALENKSC